VNKSVAVAIATYNGERFLRQQLDSILTQTALPGEIIVCDDCSSDNTVNILQEYARKFSIIKIYQNEANLGYAKNFEKAIMLCSGQYIALSDQDDIWLPNKLEVLLANIGDNLLIHSDAKLIDVNGNILEESYFNKYKNAAKSTFVDYLWSNNVTGCTAMFHRSLVERFFPIPDGFTHHDHYLSVCATYQNTIKLITIPLVLYRQHTNQIGAATPTYNKFCQESRNVAANYGALLESHKFDNYVNEIELISNYRQSFYTKKLLKPSEYYQLAKLSGGYKYVIFNLLILLSSKVKLDKLLYNYLRKTK